MYSNNTDGENDKLIDSIMKIAINMYSQDKDNILHNNIMVNLFILASKLNSSLSMEYLSNIYKYGYMNIEKDIEKSNNYKILHDGIDDINKNDKKYK